MSRRHLIISSNVFTVLYTVHCILYTVHCILYIVHFKLHTVHCILYIVHFKLHTVHCILYTVHCTLYTVHCILYTVYCTLYTVHGTLYTVQCTLYGSDYKINLQSTSFLKIYKQKISNVWVEFRTIFWVVLFQRSIDYTWDFLNGFLILECLKFSTSAKLDKTGCSLARW